ncbi:hypothetical protein [Enterococcus rivorum]|uniref:Uncharacterized protein n=1 Tax=Enterococcus rivorum TaxID=762845 RepID=A0A1E5KZ65_9ENTE|nr:hypothetical protein [Enterococcus rivorum]MBP2099436.1 hypothetical protein [Enterococcus rivorum]OEH83182.1 hypothetical protein BCR26_10925 [Enterococcus rivorum]
MKKMIWKSFRLGKKVFWWIIFLLFLMYIFYLVKTAEGFASKAIFGVVGLSVFAIVCLFEYLKMIYEKMIYALTVECDIDSAKRLKEKLQKKDLFHGFKKSLVIFDALLLLDEAKYSDCLDHLKKNDSFFRSTLDYLFIYYHTQMQCFFFLNDFDKLNEVLNKISKLKNTNKKQLRGLFTWNEIDGVNYFAQNRNKKSYDTFHSIDTTYLNNRELTYILYMKAQCLFRLEKKSEGFRMIKEMKKIGNTLAITQL